MLTDERRFTAFAALHEEKFSNLILEHYVEFDWRYGLRDLNAYVKERYCRRGTRI